MTCKMDRSTRKWWLEWPQAVTQFSSVQSLSRVGLFVTPWTAARQASLSITNSQRLLTLTSIESVMPFGHLILCCLLLLFPSVFPSIRVFSNELALFIRWPKYQSFSFSVSPSSEYSGLISFRMDWFDLLTTVRHRGFRMWLHPHISEYLLVLWVGWTHVNQRGALGEPWLGLSVHLDITSAVRIPVSLLVCSTHKLTGWW